MNLSQTNGGRIEASDNYCVARTVATRFASSFCSYFATHHIHGNKRKQNYEVITIKEIINE